MPAEQLSGTIVLIIIMAGVQAFVMLFILAKRQITRFGLRNKRGPHTSIGHGKACNHPTSKKDDTFFHVFKADLGHYDVKLTDSWNTSPTFDMSPELPRQCPPPQLSSRAKSQSTFSELMPSPSTMNLSGKSCPIATTTSGCIQLDIIASLFFQTWLFSDFLEPMFAVFS